MPRTLYIIRHGQTNANKNHIIQGQTDPGLNRTGHSQSRKLADYLGKHHIDTIYSSDLQRTKQTALPVARKKDLKINIDKKLRERDMGPFENTTWDQVFRKHPRFVDQVFESEANTLSVESNRELKARLQTLFYKIHINQQNQSVAIFTHGGTKRILISMLVGRKVSEDIRFSNTSISKLKKSSPGRYSPVFLGETPHLE